MFIDPRQVVRRFLYTALSCEDNLHILLAKNVLAESGFKTGLELNIEKSI
jgi:hypothetical protein